MSWRKMECFLSFFFFLGWLLKHMEVPRLAVKLELQLPACTTATAMQDPNHICNLHHSSPHNAGSLPHWSRPGLGPPPSQILVGPVTTELQQELQMLFSLRSGTRGHLLLRLFYNMVLAILARVHSRKRNKSIQIRKLESSCCGTVG